MLDRLLDCSFRILSDDLLSGAGGQVQLVRQAPLLAFVIVGAETIVGARTHGFFILELKYGRQPQLNCGRPVTTIV